MALIKELIKSETDGTLSFGDYSLAEKTKKDGFESLFHRSFLPIL